MHTETEIRSIITKEEYGSLMKKLESEFGKPRFMRRLAIECTDYGYQDIDTRVRVTDGKAEIIQKTGHWKNETRTEIQIPISSDSQTILHAYTLLRNMVRGGNVETPIIQLENYLFITEMFEIKLTHQSGKIDVYNFEIEAFRDNVSPLEIAKEYQMPVNQPEDTPDFWSKWNERVNLSADQMSDQELLEIISRYCN